MKKIGITAFFIFLTAGIVFASQTAQVAGPFYPANARKLDAQILAFLQGTKTSSQIPKIIIVPHAGTQYSGAVAGKGFREIQGSGASVAIVVGVAHRYPVKIEGALTDPEGTFETPLGKIEIEKETVARLRELTPKIKPEPEAFLGEHSVEVELPFLQKALPGFKLVPLVMNVPDLENAREVGDAIGRVMRENEIAGKKTVLIISSDFSHYPAQPDAAFSDFTMLKSIEAVDPEALFKASQDMMKRGIDNLETTMCGEAAVLTGLYAARSLGIVEAKVLRHATSADVPEGEKGRVVGYAAAALYEAPTHEVKDVPLQEEDKKILLQYARDSVRSFLESKPLAPETSSPAFELPRAVFVTIRKKNGDLRGCIGGTEPVWPLSQAVAYYAQAAAFKDSRFAPVSSQELDSLSFEISLLSSRLPAPNPETIQPGKHGVVLMKGSHAGLFLPQVWKETHWDRDTFLSELASQKAGLPADAWKDPDTELYTFTVDSFQDPE